MQSCLRISWLNHGCCSMVKNSGGGLAFNRDEGNATEKWSGTIRSTWRTELYLEGGLLLLPLGPIYHWSSWQLCSYTSLGRRVSPCVPFRMIPFCISGLNATVLQYQFHCFQDIKDWIFQNVWVLNQMKREMFYFTHKTSVWGTKKMIVMIYHSAFKSKYKVCKESQACPLAQKVKTLLKNICLKK